MEIICAKLTALQIDDLMKAMQPADQPVTRAPFDEIIASMKQEEKDKEDKLRAEEAKKSITTSLCESLLTFVSEQEKERPWSDEELSNLSKGLSKFPGGMPNRWDLIAELVATRNPKEIAQKVKEVKSTHMCIRYNITINC